MPNHYEDTSAWFRGFQLALVADFAAALSIPAERVINGKILEILNKEPLTIITGRGQLRAQFTLVADDIGGGRVELEGLLSRLKALANDGSLRMLFDQTVYVVSEVKEAEALSSASALSTGGWVGVGFAVFIVLALLLLWILLLLKREKNKKGFAKIAPAQEQPRKGRQSVDGLASLGMVVKKEQEGAVMVSGLPARCL